MTKSIPLALATLTTTVLFAGTAFFASTPAEARAATAPAEMTRSALEARTAAAFKRRDANGDGKLDAADRAAMQKSRFAAMDADHDGSLSFEEFTAGHGKRGGEQGAHRGDRGKHGMAMRGHRGGARLGLRGMRNADSNKDGAVTLAELQAAALARFDAVDADKDGTISPAERKAQRDTMRDKWRERRAQRQG
ncbi:EF-hand domain-containing protein [Croceibacterium aestuarii]|uniref:EF-hand domain-containing protein n=1 Tax=Croceibacterium aestuarii TaxID=3064139 RepID=UPI00272EC516|nr:EF-hand domain-containing protein [Croceibacterium sp. D39]